MCRVYMTGAEALGWIFDDAYPDISWPWPEEKPEERLKRKKKELSSLEEQVRSLKGDIRHLEEEIRIRRRCGSFSFQKGRFDNVISGGEPVFVGIRVF